MRPAGTRISNQNTKRTSHYITDVFDNRILSPGIEFAEPEEFIRRYDGGGGLLQNYEVSYSGLSDALSDALAYNVILIPICQIVGDIEVPATVTVKGQSRRSTKLYGTVTLNDGSVLENFTIDNNTTNIANPSVGVYGPVSGYNEEDPTIPALAFLYSMTIDVGSTAGPAYAVWLTCGGITAYDTELLAVEGVPGYAAYVQFGTFTHYSGRAVGTEAAPYFLAI